MLVFFCLEIFYELFPQNYQQRELSIGVCSFILRSSLSSVSLELQVSWREMSTSSPSLLFFFTNAFLFWGGFFRSTNLGKLWFANLLPSYVNTHLLKIESDIAQVNNTCELNVKEKYEIQLLHLHSINKH